MISKTYNLSTTGSNFIRPLYIHYPPSMISPTQSLEFPRKRRRFRTLASSSVVLPLLPFPVEQVLVPSEAKTLHLYEARYIALLEESLFQKNKMFVHFVLDPISSIGASTETYFAARYGCLVVIEKVEQLEIGALVSIRGVGRVNLLQFEQTEPYLTGQVRPLQDNNGLYEMTELSSKALELKESLYSLNNLEMKLKAPGEALLQTHTQNSLVWAEKQLLLDHCITDFIPPVHERVSFAAYQPISGATKPELLKLQKEKLKGMELTDTFQRLLISMDIVRENIATIAAKLAIQSLELR